MIECFLVLAVVWAIAASAGWLGSSRVVSALRLEIDGMKDQHERSIQWYSRELFKYQDMKKASTFAGLEQLPITKAVPFHPVTYTHQIGNDSVRNYAKPAKSDGAYNNARSVFQAGDNLDSLDLSNQDSVVSSVVAGLSSYDDDNKSYSGPVEVDSCPSSYGGGNSYDSGSSYDGGGSFDSGSSSSFD